MTKKLIIIIIIYLDIFQSILKTLARSILKLFYAFIKSEEI